MLQYEQVLNYSLKNIPQKIKPPILQKNLSKEINWN